MNRFTIAHRVSVITAILITLVLFAGAAGMLGMSGMKAITSGLRETNIAKSTALAEAEYLIFELRGHVFLAASPGVSAELKRETTARSQEIKERLTALFNNLNSAVPSNSPERSLFETLKAQQSGYQNLLLRFQALEAAGKHDEAMAAVARECIPQRRALQKSFGAEIKWNERGLASAIGNIASTGTTYFTITACIFGVAVVGGCLLAYFVIRGIRLALQQSASRIHVSAQEIHAASCQVASASELLAQDASQQAASLEETSASTGEISAMARRNSEHSGSAAQLMLVIDQRLSLANQRLVEMISTMDQISNASNQIAKITKVVDGIAFQTNILALNAAVEAARAGDAGAGFAVVADEVRSLAHRSAEAANTITSLIEASVNSARAGEIRLAEVTEIISKVTKSALEGKTLVDEVNQGGQEQFRGVEQISSVLVQMEQITQRSAASAEESAAASRELKSQAESMNSVLVHLEVLI